MNFPRASSPSTSWPPWATGRRLSATCEPTSRPLICMAASRFLFALISHIEPANCCAIGTAGGSGRASGGGSWLANEDPSPSPPPAQDQLVSAVSV